MITESVVVHNLLEFRKDWFMTWTNALQ